MQKIMFNDRYGLTDAVLDGRKIVTRRVIPKDIAETLIIEGDGIFPDIPCEGLMEYSRYKIGEEVAIAQKYSQIFTKADLSKRKGSLGDMITGKAWDNKMFVQAAVMPHRIRITDIRVERLQDISDEDCLREGIYRWKDAKDCPKCVLNNPLLELFGFDGRWDAFPTPRKAFAALIDKVSGKGTWESNPYVWVYSFELIK